MKTLVLTGGGTLTFGARPGRRTVRAGEPFEVGDDLAAVLLADPSIALAGDVAEAPAAEERPAGPITLADLPHGALKARARELGLPASGGKVALTAAIAAEEARLAEAEPAEPQGGSETPADDPGAAAPGEAGTPPPSEFTVVGTAPEVAPAGDRPSGAITLGDLPASAIKDEG